MELTREQRSQYTRLLRLGTGGPLISDQGIAGLAVRTAAEIRGAGVTLTPELDELAEYDSRLPDLYAEPIPSRWGIDVGLPPHAVYARIANSGLPDATLFFGSLAELHKRRVRYERILENQSIPTLDQVGPRSLLEYGTTTEATLAAFLLWRKWLFDIDNRAGQETGYAFEPPLAAALGGTAASHGESPVRRIGKAGGRQVDCIIDDETGKFAYEFKIRVTIAASGQGRWGEELSFPEEAITAGYKPVLVVFDSTENSKLTELKRRFDEHGGESHLGADAWAHLRDRAGLVMGRFVEHYLRRPLEAVIAAEPDRDSMPDLRVSMSSGRISISIDGDTPKEITRPLVPKDLGDADEAI